MLGHRALNADDYLAILKRRWWMVAIPTILLPILAIASTFFIPPQYLSVTSVLIDQQKVPDDLVKPVVSEDINSRLASMNEQILSRSSIQPIVEKFNLYASQHLSMDDRIALARKSIEIKEMSSDVAHSNGLPGFTISFTASDAHTAQMVCAEITSLFTGANLRSREAAAEGTTDFLKEQLDNAKATLDDQDAKLAAFQHQYFGMLPEDEANNINILGTLNTQLEAATQSLSRMEQDRSYLDTLLAQQPSASPNIASPQTQDQQLQDLLTKQADLTSHYTNDYPDVIAINRKIADMRKQMARSNAAPAASAPAVANKNDSASVQDLRARIRAADLGIQEKRNEQTQLGQQIRLYQGRIQSTPKVEEQFKELTRDTQTSQVLYDSDLTKLNQSQMATDLEHRQEGETFRVLDEANLPDGPTFPKRRVFAVAGLAAGLALGLLLVALLEYKDTTMRSERDVWAFTQLPTLAVIAWSSEVAGCKPAKISRTRRIFRRKSPKNRVPLHLDNHV
jgi:polysaccharide chain length determinant protein (PEP-CTERM system associated)